VGEKNEQIKRGMHESWDSLKFLGSGERDGQVGGFTRSMKGGLIGIEVCLKKKKYRGGTIKNIIIWGEREGIVQTLYGHSFGRNPKGGSGLLGYCLRLEMRYS